MICKQLNIVGVFKYIISSCVSLSHLSPQVNRPALEYNYILVNVYVCILYTYAYIGWLVYRPASTM